MTRRPARERPVARAMPLRPEPGLFKARLGKGCPWVAAKVEWAPAIDPETGEPMDRPPVLTCLVAGEEVDVHEMWTWLHPVSPAEYRALVRDMPDDPRAPADLGRAAPAF